MENALEFICNKVKKLEEENAELKQKIKALEDKLDPLKYVDLWDGPSLGGLHGD